MVLQVMKYDVHPDKAEAYTKWTEGAIKTTVGGPGVVEFRGYRPVTGGTQVAITYEFADLAAWAAWSSDEAVQRVLNEMRALTLNLEIEVWGPSPIVPQPLRPGK